MAEASEGRLTRAAREVLAWVRRLRPSATQRLGRRGEQAAADYLRSLGYRILARNAVVPMGEADIVAESPDGAIVIVEVKTRERTGHAISDRVPPEAAVTARKRRKLRTIARHLTKANGWNDQRVRIDVIAVEVGLDGLVNVRHSPGAV